MTQLFSLPELASVKPESSSEQPKPVFEQSELASLGQTNVQTRGRAIRSAAQKEQPDITDQNL